MNQQNNKQHYTRVVRKPHTNGGENKEAPRVIKRRFNTADNFRNKRFDKDQNPSQQNEGGAPKRSLRSLRRPPMRGGMERRKKTPDEIPPLAPGDIRIIPIGGVEEIGRNMTVVEFKDQIIVIDVGIEFTDEETPGIDYIIPNTKYLEERKHLIKGIVITHGHLDHIGAIPYLIDKIGNPPIYTREFGALLIKKRQEEFPHLPPLDIRIIENEDHSVRLSEDLKVKFFGLTHSIPDSTGIIIETPYGGIVSTGDVRVDNNNGVPLDKEYEQYKFFKNENIVLMTMDSTGVPKPGWSISERQVIETVDGIIRDVKGRLIIATFASQVERIIEFIKSVKKYGKFVVIEGRAMKTNLAIVKQLNLTDLSHVIPVEDMASLPPNKIVMLATGAQGEEFAALDRISRGTHKYVKLTEHDTIVFSSSAIPGNETSIDKLKDRLYKHDPKVITYTDSDVHASGHGKRGELEWIHKQINYRFFMPVHGSHFMLKMHRDLAESLGAKRENIVIPENGSIIEIRKEGTELVKLPVKAVADPIMVDGFRIGDIQDVVLRDRKMLSEDGMFVVVTIIDPATMRLRKSPDIVSRGFIYLRDNQDLLYKCRGLIKKTAEDTASATNLDIEAIKNEIGERVSRFLLQKTAKRPIVIPVVLAF